MKGKPNEKQSTQTEGLFQRNSHQIEHGSVSSPVQQESNQTNSSPLLTRSYENSQEKNRRIINIHA